ncbi:hypothetical protein CAEBREN_31344 [Caenorhabditis brenneri]|uniref:Ion transport domain-containing protein n=1 Tax=Caenorhabditis brenneri TaxID=135651 RepID=G0PG36_CAEBE|nr:hypothetical protein CAEBREN_31344 [Caenorhabditis brenneri]
MCRVFLITFILPLEAVQNSIAAFETPNEYKTTYYSGFVSVLPLVELMYCLLFIISDIATLRFFYSFKSPGFLTHVIKKMLNTVSMFILIFCAFWFVLAVTHVSISRTFSSEDSSTNNTFIHTIVSKGKFEIFGEVQDGDITGNLKNCSNYDRTIYDIFSMDYHEASCLFRSSILPFLVFIYIFMAGILLVNLLTAQLTKEYEKESENSRYYNGYLQYEQLCKIESKIYLPPPLSIVYVFVSVLLRSPCCSGHCFRFICEKILKRIDGDPFQAVRNYPDHFGAEAKVKEFLRKKQNTTWGRMKNLITELEQEDSSYEELMAVQTQLNILMDSEKNKVVARENNLSEEGMNIGKEYIPNIGEEIDL